MRVSPKKRVNGLAGWWHISRAQAKTLCDAADVPLPRMGYEVIVAEDEHVPWYINPRNGRKERFFLKTKIRAKVANVCGGFQLRDTNRVLVEND